MHEVTSSFAWRTAQALTEASLVFIYSDFDMARQAADRARRVMEAELGPKDLSHSACKRLMFFEGEVRWLLAVLYDDQGACRVPLEHRPPFQRLSDAADLSHLVSEIQRADNDLMKSMCGRPNAASALRYIARRLESVDNEDMRTAARKVHSALELHGDSVSEKVGDIFYDSIRVDVTRAADMDSFSPEHRQLVSALEVELAGYVHGIRLAEGKLVHSEFAISPRSERRGILRRLFGSC